MPGFCRYPSAGVYQTPKDTPNATTQPTTTSSTCTASLLIERPTFPGQPLQSAITLKKTKSNMKEGKTLTEIAAELHRQKSNMRDFIAPTQQLTLEHPELRVSDKGYFPVTDHAHSQIAGHLKIPKGYYDRLRSTPELLNRNVNHWLSQREGEKRLVRTLDGNARALLSERYRPFDNYQVALNSLEALKAADCRVASCEVTSRRFYLKAVSNRIETEVKKGDVVQAGVVISNSEVGSGSLRVEPLIYSLICDNGMISADSSYRRPHIGSALTSKNSGAIEFFTDETREASDQVVFLQVRDIVAATMTDTGFEQLVERFAASQEKRLEADAFETVELLRKNESLAESEGKGILASLLRGEDSDTLFGLVNAVTDYSKKVESYDRATELERLGGKLLEGAGYAA